MVSFDYVDVVFQEIENSNSFRKDHLSWLECREKILFSHMFLYTLIVIYLFKPIESEFDE